jgi:hypothetical protein
MDFESLDEKKKATPSQPERKVRIPDPLVALKTCTVQLENCTVELVEGQFIYGLTRQERNHLKFHGFIK